MTYSSRVIVFTCIISTWWTERPCGGISRVEIHSAHKTSRTEFLSPLHELNHSWKGK